MKKHIRILIVEDNATRAERICHWIPQGIVPILASSAGLAIGIIQRDFKELAGLMLDHDLQEQRITESDAYLSGTDVTRTIIQYLPKDIPILVHSMNPSGAQRVSRQLESAGFWVTRIPMSELDQSDIDEWLEEVISNATEM